MEYCSKELWLLGGIMELETLDNGMLRIRFEKTDGKNTFNDALIFSQAEYDALTEQQIEEIKQQRFDNWLAIINYVPPAE
jgi:hypothetical protein